MSGEELQKAMFPWQSYYDEDYSKYYYFNALTDESVWELPADIMEKITLMVDSKKDAESNEKKRIQKEEEVRKKQPLLVEREHFDTTEIRNMDQFLDKKITQKRHYGQDTELLMKRPAKKQADAPANSKTAYMEGGMDYNIWYDKYQSESRDEPRVREKAKGRLDPDLDTGYTKADLMEKYSSSFCMHYAKGQCCEGSNCRYYHRVPCLAECELVDNSRDIFGRPRFAEMREDMEGIGSFSKDTRTILVQEFKMPIPGSQGVELMYEVLWRHFSIYGQIEDIVIKGVKGWAFIRFQHRCMAEFCKESMINQSLDTEECVLIKWAADDEKDPIEEERKAREQKERVSKAVIKRAEDDKLRQHNEIMQDKREEIIKFRLEKELKQQQDDQKKDVKIQESISRMVDILDDVGEMDVPQFNAEEFVNDEQN